MQVIQRLSQPLYNQTESDEASLLSHQEKLQQTNKAQAELSKIDQQLSGLVEGTASAKVLAMIAAQQKQVVMAMLGANPEMAIAGILAQGIETYGSMLELLQQWTEGGDSAVQAALSVMLEDLVSNAVSTVDFEDLLQVALLDFINNVDNWPGAADIVANSRIYRLIRKFLGNFGSGSHVSHENGEPLLTQSEIQEIFNAIADIAPQGSVANEALNYLGQQDLNAIFHDMSHNYYQNNQGWYEGSFGAGLSDPAQADDELVPDMDSGMSPVMRLSLLQQGFLNGDIDYSSVGDVLTGDMEHLVDLFGSNPFSYIDNNHGTNDWWQVWQYPSNDGQIWAGPDFDGVGVGSEFINELVNAFPVRELTEDEVKEINRIGDQVRMLQETLKYWLSIIRDGQLQTARNI